MTTENIFRKRVEEAIAHSEAVMKLLNKLMSDDDTRIYRPAELLSKVGKPGGMNSEKDWAAAVSMNQAGIKRKTPKEDWDFFPTVKDSWAAWEEMKKSGCWEHIRRELDCIDAVLDYLERQCKNLHFMDRTPEEDQALEMYMEAGEILEQAKIMLESGTDPFERVQKEG